MMNLANLIASCGLIALVVAGWMIHPATGMAMLGLECLAVGIALARKDMR